MGVSKNVVWHKASKYANKTECGVLIGAKTNIRKTYNGVTCKRCLKKKGKK